MKLVIITMLVAIAISGPAQAQYDARSRSIQIHERELARQHQQYLQHQYILQQYQMQQQQQRLIDPHHHRYQQQRYQHIDPIIPQY